MFSSTLSTLCLLAASSLLQLSNAAVITTGLLLPMDQVSGSDSGPAITFSVAGVGSDGRTTYVATESDSAVTAAFTYALGASDFVEIGAVAASGTESLTVSEACTFAHGATAGAVATCNQILGDPKSTDALTMTNTETLAISSMVLAVSSAPPSASVTPAPSSPTGSAGTQPSPTSTSSKNGDCLSASPKTSILMSAILGAVVLAF